MNKITDRLYLGSYSDSLELLYGHPIKAIMSVRGPDRYTHAADAEALLAKEFHFRHVPLVDNGPVSLEHFNLCMKYMDDLYASDFNILVHCWAGISRSAVILAAFMVRKGLASNLFDALLVIKSNRDIDPAPETLSSVLRLMGAQP